MEWITTRGAAFYCVQSFMVTTTMCESKSLILKKNFIRMLGSRAVDSFAKKARWAYPPGQALLPRGSGGERAEVLVMQIRNNTRALEVFSTLTHHSVVVVGIDGDPRLHRFRRGNHAVVVPFFYFCAQLCELSHNRPANRANESNSMCVCTVHEHTGGGGHPWLEASVA